MLAALSFLREGFCDTGSVRLAQAWPGLGQSSRSQNARAMCALRPRASPTEVAVERLETTALAVSDGSAPAWKGRGHASAPRGTFTSCLFVLLDCPSPRSCCEHLAVVH